MLDAAATPSLHQHQQDAGHPPPTPCGRTPWAVIYTHPKAERWAASNLTQRGYRTYLPLVTVTRRDRVLPTLRHAVEVPLFPRYCFVADDGPWTPVRYAPGVASLLMHDNHPAHVSGAVVEAIQAAIAERATNEPAPASWAPGDPVRLIMGAFRGHPAVVLSVRTISARVAVMIMGAMREAVVPIAALTHRE